MWFAAALSSNLHFFFDSAISSFRMNGKTAVCRSFLAFSNRRFIWSYSLSLLIHYWSVHCCWVPSFRGSSASCNSFFNCFILLGIILISAVHCAICTWIGFTGFPTRYFYLNSSVLLTLLSVSLSFYWCLLCIRSMWKYGFTYSYGSALPDAGAYATASSESSNSF